MASKIIIDTSLYIDWYNGHNLESFAESSYSITYLSGMVMAELLSGCHKVRERRHFEGLRNNISPARYVPVTLAVASEAGHIARVYGSKTILADAIIAMSARSIGAEVWTRNERDYLAIKRSRPFKLRCI